MPARATNPASDPPATAADHAPWPDADQPMLGDESAMPWLQVAAPAAGPVQPPWPGSPAG